MSSSRQSPIPPLAPFLMEPRYDERVWGFRDLRPWYDHVAEADPIGEVWLTGDDCRVATGLHAGKTLAAFFGECHEALLGPGAPSPDSPLLVKVIFAREKLSVQVHPDDKMAQKYGQPRGKTECWYALAAEPDAEIALGLKPGVTLAQIEEQIHAGTLEDSLQLVRVQAGDTIFVDAGTVHAIFPGSILLETQQNCDLTYRMFDYGRPRELHIEKSLEATKLVTRAGKIAPQQLEDRTVLIDAEYFRVEKVAVQRTRTSESLRAPRGRREMSWLFAADGEGRLTGPGFEPVDLPTRGIVGVPAASPKFVLEDLSGPGKSLDLIRITPNWPEPDLPEKAQ